MEQEPEITEQVNLVTRLIGDIQGDFYIPAYQRGYRWDAEVEVKTLLDDINLIGKTEPYCLQPVVVKTRGDGQYELIDGQQRLTTLYLIMLSIKKQIPAFKIKFSLDYETRPKSRDFLSKINEVNMEYHPQNIDEDYILKAYRKIGAWFEEQEDTVQTAINFTTKLNEQIRVIWYEVRHSENSRNLFARLNIGRIPLTNSELIKALFLSKDAQNTMPEERQIKIAAEWDRMERDLQDNVFWYFLTNNSPAAYPTRVDLIFDMMAHKAKNDKEVYRTFFFFYDEIHKAINGECGFFFEDMEKANDGQSDVSASKKLSKLDIWEIIQRYYMLLKGLYENRSLYHKIGYLIAVNVDPVPLIDECQKKRTKSDYEDYLNEKIAKSIEFLDYLDLSYEKTEDKDKLSRLLLLFNIETTNQIKDSSVRFPFDKYKDARWWSLEHIHAQHSEGLNKEDQWIAYLKYHRDSLETVKRQLPDKAEKIGELISKIDTVLESKITEAIFRPLSQAIAGYFDDVDNEQMHRLSNMALLSIPDNAALNNSAFDVKRKIILERDKKGEFIPMCTRQVFLKYYSTSLNSPLCFWTRDDRGDYLNEIGRVLRPYLSVIGKKIKGEEKDI
jgi:uncharacterized protein with ParB-like and HNH nuclease domain